MELSVYNISGVETGKKAKLSEEVFGVTPNEHVVYLDVKNYQANQRQGTHKSKQRNEVAYSTKKIKKQKGTGGARAGSIKSPVFVGGGRIFGPVPRDYGLKINKKVKELARKSALSAKALENKITILEDFSFDAPKTKDYISFLNAFELNGKKTLLVLGDINKNVILSGRNIPKTNITVASQLNTYDLLNADVLLVSESALAKLNGN